MIRERYYYAVAAFMRKDGKLTYTSVTSSVKGGEEEDIKFYPIMDLITDVEEKFKDDMVSGTTLIHSVIEISKEDYDAYNDHIAKMNEKEG